MSSSSSDDSNSGDSGWSLILVSPEKLQPTETVEEIRVLDLNEALGEGVIRDPLLVVRNDENFLVIDGNTRASFAKARQVEAVLVQVVEPANVEPGTWVLRAEVNITRLIRNLENSGFRVGPSVSNPICWINTKTDCLAVSMAESLHKSRVNAGRLVVDVFKSLAHGKRLERVADNLPYATDCFGEVVALKFATLTLAEIVEAVDRGELAGAGIPRWTLKKGVRRILGTCMPMGIKPELLEQTLKSPERASVRSFCDCGSIVHVDVRWMRTENESSWGPR